MHVFVFSLSRCTCCAFVYACLHLEQRDVSEIAVTWVFQLDNINGGDISFISYTEHKYTLNR